MLLDRKTHSFQDVDSPQIFLQIQIPMGSLCGTQKVILKFKWKDKKPMTKTLVRKKMEFGQGEEWDLPYQISNFILSVVIKMAWIQHRDSIKPMEHTGEPRNRYSMKT